MLKHGVWMVFQMNKNIEKATDDLVKYIKDQKEYKRCIHLKKIMKDDLELMQLIDKVKKAQKEYIKSGYDKNKLEKLDALNKELEKYPIYFDYNNNLKIINDKINTLVTEINEYFDSVISFDI